MRKNLKINRLFRFIVLGMLCSVLAACAGTGIPVKSGDMLFEDDFSTSGGGWGVWEREDSGVAYDQGGLHIKVNKGNLNTWSVAGKNFEDVIMTVDARPLAGPQDNIFGLICRYQDNDNFYYFLVSSDGYYAIVKNKDGVHSMVGMDMMQYSELIPKSRKLYKLTAACIDDKLTLAVNGKLLGEGIDADFGSGDVGVLGSSLTTPGVEILFDNFKVRAPQ